MTTPKTDPAAPPIAPFNPDKTLTIRRAGNGGWVVLQAGQQIGAYSTGADLLAGLAPIARPATLRERMTRIDGHVTDVTIDRSHLDD